MGRNRSVSLQATSVRQCTGGLRTITLLFCGGLAAGLACSGAERSPLLSAADLDAIAAADAEYVTAWLSNEPERVMATLTEDAVIVPSGLPAVEGLESIRAFWWPVSAPPTTVTEFGFTQDEVGGYGDLGLVRGSFTLGFEYDGKASRTTGDYISILRRLSSGAWRISHRMWNDRAP